MLSGAAPERSEDGATLGSAAQAASAQQVAGLV
jgi:hypothetical protein